MNTTFWSRISNIGVQDHQDFRLSSRIVLSNRFAVLIAALTLIFMIVFLVRGSTGLLPFLGMLVISGTIFFFNSIGLTQVSRLITCLIPAVGIFVLNISQKFGVATGVDILHYATPRMIIIGSAVLPFTMFTATERGYVWGGAGFIVALALSYDVLHDWMGIDHISLGLKNEHYSIVFEDTVVLGIIVVAAAGFLFSMNYRYDEHAQHLLDEALEQTASLKKNEEDLRKTLHELELSRVKEEHRSWVAKGVAELALILQTGDNDDQVYQHWLTSTIKYLNLNQGGLFVADEENGKTVLKLVASYAYERRKYQDRTIVPGEGLLGQTYLEGRRIYLKKIPQNYIRITSGLGEATPGVLVILPVKTNVGTEAVLELASFKPLEEHHLELLDRLADALAAFISNYKTNERTKTLLTQARTMSEEMRASEEEMRQNLEELTATQEALARKEKEYQERIAELEAEVAELRSTTSFVIDN